MKKPLFRALFSILGFLVCLLILAGCLVGQGSAGRAGEAVGNWMIIQLSIMGMRGAYRWFKGGMPNNTNAAATQTEPI
jgi:hypothetical protein